jgi:hypothetical protein
MICKRKYDRFYYPKGIAGFWSAHVNEPLCRYEIKTKNPVDFFDLLYIENFEKEVDDMCKLFTCTKTDIEIWINEIIDEKVNESHDYYVDKYGKIPEQKDEEDNKYDRDFALSSSPEIHFYSTIGTGKDIVAVNEFKRQVASAIANTNMTIWFTILQDKNIDKKYISDFKEGMIEFINETENYDVYWMKELVPIIEKLTGKKIDQSFIV